MTGMLIALMSATFASAGGPDSFEPGDRAAIAQSFSFPETSLLQLHKFHRSGDEDRYAFPDTRPCQYFYDWTLATASGDGRFQPIVVKKGPGLISLEKLTLAPFLRVTQVLVASVH